MEFNFNLFAALFVAFAAGACIVHLHYSTAMIARGVPQEVDAKLGFDKDMNRVILLVSNKHMGVRKECVVLLKITDARQFSASIDKTCDEYAALEVPK